MLIWGIILGVVLASGCSENTTQESVLTPQYPPEPEDPFYPISLNEGITLVYNLFAIERDLHNESIPLYFAQGKRVNQTGKAEQWILGVSVSGDTYFVIIESNRGVLVPYEMAFPERTIDLPGILLPDALISGNIQLLQKEFGGNGLLPPLQLELMDRTYSLTPSGDSGKKMLYFDALTGRPLNL